MENLSIKCFTPKTLSIMTKCLERLSSLKGIYYVLV